MATGTSINHIPTGTPASVSVTSSAVDALNYTFGSFTLTSASANNLDGTIKVQISNDGTQWADFAAATTVAANQEYTISLTSLPKRYLRTVYVHGTNTLGTIYGTFVLKG